MIFRLLLVNFFTILLFGATVTLAETDVEVSGQVRVRHEVDSRQFHQDGTTKEYADMRTRVQIAATVDGNAHAVVQLQDTRRFGGLINNQETSGTLNNTHNVDIHQAFLQIDQLWAKGPGLKLGRFEFNMGNQRVFGAVGWHNVARSWEGLQLWHDLPKVKFTGFVFKRHEANDPIENEDFTIYGINTKIKELGAEVFAFRESDAENVSFYSGVSPTSAAVQDEDDVNMLSRTNFGVFIKRSHEQFDFAGNAVYQTGEIIGTDIAAMMFALEVGYSFPGEHQARLAAGIDYSSGDDDGTDDEINLYNNSYYTGHKFRGFMDYFLGSNAAGLIDLMLRGKVSPAPGWLLKGDLHYFKTAADYTDFTGEETTDVGTELDLSVSTKKVAGVGLTAGTSVFLPSEAYAEMEDPETGFWFYTMATVTF